MLFRLNLMVTIFLAALLLLLSGSTNGTVPQHDELIYYVEKGEPKFSSYCKEVDPVTLNCYSNKIERFDDLSPLDNSALWHGNVKQDIAVFSSAAGVEYKVDVETFNFPVYSMYGNRPYPKVIIMIKQGLGLTDSKVIFEDRDNKCGPLSVTPSQLHNFNLYVNVKWNKNAYYFISNRNKTCIYTLKHEDLFHPPTADGLPQKTIHAVNFYSFENFQDHAPNFYCIDPLYGAFVALYWDKHPGHPPQAHFFFINEKDLRPLFLIHGIILTGFDETVLKAIFNNDFDETSYPTFTSYGRQIFVWFKFRNENRAFNGLWKTDKEYRTFFENPVDSSNENYRKIWHAKKSYIQINKPVGRYDAPTRPEFLDLPDITPSPELTTLPPRATSEVPTTAKKATTALPSTTKQATTALPSTVAPSTPPPTTTTSKATTTVGVPTSTFPETARETNKSHVEAQTAKDKCDDNDLYFLLLIACGAASVIEAIILVILIFLKCQGAKKIKAAAAKKKKSRKHSVTKTTVEKSKKSTIEKTTKTEDVTGKKTTEQESADVKTTELESLAIPSKKSSKKNKKGKKH